MKSLPPSSGTEQTCRIKTWKTRVPFISARLVKSQRQRTWKMAISGHCGQISCKDIKGFSHGSINCAAVEKHRQTLHQKLQKASQYDAKCELRIICYFVIINSCIHTLPGIMYLCVLLNLRLLCSYLSNDFFVCIYFLAAPLMRLSCCDRAIHCIQVPNTMLRFGMVRDANTVTRTIFFAAIYG